MKDKQVLFRDSFKGYNKDDVNAYLTIYSKKLGETEDNYKAEIQSLQKNIEEYKKEIDALKSPEKNPFLSSLLEENAALKEKNKELESLLEAQTSEIDHLNNQNLLLNEQIQELKSQADSSEKDPSLTEKARLYDQMSSQIGVVLLQANENSANIINEAYKKANEIQSEASQNAQKIKIDTREEIDLILSKLDNNIRNITGNYVSEINSISNEFNNHLDLFLSGLKDYCCKLEKKSQEVLEEIEQTTEKSFTPSSEIFHS